MNELGQKLRQARIDKGYTIDDLQQITKIQKRYLLAIEEGNFDQLPGKFYVNAFIKQYAQTVGLDGQALLNEYQGTDQKQPTETTTDDQATETTTTTKTESKPTAANSRFVGNEAKTSKFDKIRGYLPQIIIIAVVLILIIGIYSIALNHRNNSSQTASDATSSSVKVTDERKSSSKAEKASESKKAASSSQKAASADKASRRSASASRSKAKAKSEADTDTLKISKVSGTRTASAQTYRLKNYPASNNTVNISATEDSTWVTVTANGTTTWQGSVTAGTPQAVQLPSGISSFIVTSGNASVTKLKVNDTSVDLPATTSSNVVQNYTFQIQQSTNND